MPASPTLPQAVITTRILQLVHELCTKRIHVTKRDLFYTGGWVGGCLGAWVPGHSRGGLGQPGRCAACCESARPGRLCSPALALPLLASPCAGAKLFTGPRRLGPRRAHTADNVSRRTHPQT